MKYFLKWAGGKYRLVDLIKSTLPKKEMFYFHAKLQYAVVEVVF